MKTLCIIDRYDKRHYLQNVVSWVFVDREFRIRIHLIEDTTIEIPHTEGNLSGDTHNITIDISVIERLSDVS